MRYTRSPSVFSDSSLSASFLRTTAAKNPRTECGCQPVDVMIVAVVAPLGRRSNPSTRACFEFARLLCWSPRAAFARTLDEACALAVRPRLRLDMPKLLSLVPAQHRAATTQTPRRPTGRWRGRGAKPSGLLSVTTTDALLALKVQRKVSNGVAGLAAAGSSLDRQKIAASPAITAIDQRPHQHPC